MIQYIYIGITNTFTNSFMLIDDANHVYKSSPNQSFGKMQVKLF